MIACVLTSDYIINQHFWFKLVQLDGIDRLLMMCRPDNPVLQDFELLQWWINEMVPHLINNRQLYMNQWNVELDWS